MQERMEWSQGLAACGQSSGVLGIGFRVCLHAALAGNMLPCAHAARL